MAFKVRFRSFWVWRKLDIAVMEGREKEALADQLGVEIRAVGFAGTGVIALKGDVEHGRDAGEFGTHLKKAKTLTLVHSKVTICHDSRFQT